MQYRSLGNTGVKVSAIGFGALGMGSVFYGKKDRAESLRTIDRALDLGINFFDTCPSYGDSEEILGLAFKGRRDQVVIATKISTNGFSTIAESVEHSLRRLQTDYLDLLQLRDPTPEKVARHAVLESLAALKEQGKIRFGSVTVGDNQQAAQTRYAIEAGFAAVQLAYNLIFRAAASESLPRAGAAGTGVVVRGSLCKGFLTGRIQSVPEDARKAGSFSQFTLAEAETLIAIQRDLAFLHLPGKRTLAQAAVQFALRPGAVSTVIPSMDQVAEVEEIAGALEAPQLTEAEIARAIEVIENHPAVEY
ncbi:MAG: aldo/keto reductase [Candidatus Latescibacteria bacterium]|nr:aldo/keto reductase [Candidatus Latescibacterota bacterium]